MNRCEILNKLRGLAQKYSNILAKRDGVLGIVISGSLARGNVWEGSDVDLHVLWDSEGQESYVEGMFTSFTDDFVLRWDEDMLINIHDEYVGDVESIIGDVNRLCGSELPDQVYGCEVVFDPHGMWTRYKSVIDSIRFEPEFIAKKVDFHIQQALTLISKAEKSLALEDYASAVFHAQRAAIEVAFGATVECGGLIRSAQRFPENLKALAEKHGLEGLYERFRTIHGE
jgi:predicted nucleotidyltransferase